MFYGLPIHIMRDLFLTTRSFLKRLSALVRYRKALQDMNRYPDATQEELGREDTCIICREDMRPWDPTVAGAVERSRPKKLPCGHILHFGCLKSWLERQQVCPTCRRSVVIDGAAPHGDGAAGLNAGGPPPAPGQPAPDNGAANGNQARPARGGMRMFQLGPLRLGFAQGNPQNIQDMLAQRFGGAPLNPANAQPTQAIPAALHPPQAATPGNNNIYEMNAQLQDIAQRLQHEVQALQATQAELQTLYALMAELQRLRLYQQQLQNVQHPGQIAIAPNGQLPLPQQPVYHQTLPQFPSMAQNPATFSPFQQRINTPSITRHAAASFSTSIPAGSPDLPEGVVLPQGWSLMPLQRMDGQTQQVAVNLTGLQAEGPEQPQQVSQPASQDAATRHVDEPSPANGEHISSQHNAPTSSFSEASSSQARTEPPLVAAPTPVAPNWGGSAQLFANGGVGTPVASSSVEPERKDDVPEVGQLDSEHQEESNGSDKGKAKAVTIEDAEDE
jgi:E3 ubiquitin-protein ligase synoviolin